MCLATGGYTTGRRIAHLRDRDVHQQSIWLENADSRNCYLGIVGSALGAASGGAVAATARSVQIGKSLGSQIVFTSIAATSCAVNSLGVVNGSTNIVQKVVDDEQITGSDIFYVTSSVLFFTNSVISTNHATTLIKNSNSFMSEITKLANRTTRSVTGLQEVVYV